MNSSKEPQKTNNASINQPKAVDNGKLHQFVDNRPEAIQMKRWQQMADNSPQALQRKVWQQMAENSPQVQQRKALQEKANNYPSPLQRMAIPEEEEVPQLMAQEEEEIPQLMALEEEEPLQRSSALKEEEEVPQLMAQEEEEIPQLMALEEEEPLQRMETPEEELLQGKLKSNTVQRKTNNTGLPDGLKNGVENLSGYSMDDVKVHYNSPEPAQLNAHAYAQGTDIHLASGQEKHLPHEAWHVVQQKQGRVQPTTQLKGKVNIHDDAGLEKEADVMGAKAMQMKGDGEHQLKKNTQTSPTLQLRKIENLVELKTGIIKELNAGEEAAGSSENLLSIDSSNVSKLCNLYVLGGFRDAKSMNANLKRKSENEWMQGWYDRIDARVRAGAKQTMTSMMYWAKDMKKIFHAEEVDLWSIQLLGDELHDRGLGAAKATFLIEHNHNPMVAFTRTYVIKPEDRSIEKAILGSGDSVATRLNEGLSTGRQVNTLDMKTHPEHGTIMEYVTTSVKTIGESILRKVHFWDSKETVTAETIALAFLTGIYDLHAHNVMSKGSAPALIDADVAMRPTEITEGPSQQNGLSMPATDSIKDQLGGTQNGASQILDYAIQHPDEVTKMITELVGHHRSRIVPVFTKVLADALLLYVIEKKDGENAAAMDHVSKAARVAAIGDKDGSIGLKGELGDDQAGLWNFGQVVGFMATDFDKGVIPHFQYQASNGRAYLHNTPIWQGHTLAYTMKALKVRLQQAAEAKKKV